MKIIDLLEEDSDLIQQTAELLVIGFKAHYPDAWPDVPSAVVEVRQSLIPTGLSRIMLSESRAVLGWTAARPQYALTGWELHPLVVHPDYHGQGIGRALVSDLEEQVRGRGGVMIYLGTDDADYQTTLGGKDLYPNVVEHISAIKNINRHPYEFYQKLGYTITGVIPDANGPGRPDIIMAKRL